MNGYEKLISECDENLLFYTTSLETLRRKIAMEDELKKDFSRIPGNKRHEDWEEMRQFDSYVGYVTIAILDLSVNLKNLVIAATDWEKAYCIKQAYLTIHETLQHLQPPKDDLSFIQQIIDRKYPELKPQLEEITRKIISFRDKDG